MSSGTPTPILGLKTFNDSDAVLQDELDFNSTQVDTIPPTVCTSSTRPATNLYQGRFIYETDTDRLLMYDKTTTTWKNISQGVWIDFVPKVYTAMATTPAIISGTPGTCRFTIIGKTVFANASVQMNALTSGGAGVDLPFTAKDRYLDCGTLTVVGGTPPSDQSSIAYMASDKAKLVCVAATGGFRDAPASGYNIRYSVQYELP